MIKLLASAPYIIRSNVGLCLISLKICPILFFWSRFCSSVFFSVCKPRSTSSNRLGFLRDCRRGHIPALRSATSSSTSDVLVRFSAFSFQDLTTLASSTSTSASSIPSYTSTSSTSPSSFSASTAGANSQDSSTIPFSASSSMHSSSYHRSSRACIMDRSVSVMTRVGSSQRNAYPSPSSAPYSSPYVCSGSDGHPAPVHWVMPTISSSFFGVTAILFASLVSHLTLLSRIETKRCVLNHRTSSRITSQTRISPMPQVC